MAITNNIFSQINLVDYQAARTLIKSGDILLCSGTSFFSNMIKRATNSIWSHVAFILRVDAIDRIMVLESVESIGVRTVPLSSYVYNYNGTQKSYPGKILIARHTQFNPLHIQNLSKYAVDLLGYPYDAQQIAYIVSRLAMKLIDKRDRDDIMLENHSYICSEYAYECYKSVGITVNFNTDGYIAPSDFAHDPMVQTVAALKQ